MASDRHERTEKPTAKRKSEARKKGQTAKSTDIASWSAVLAGSYLVPYLIVRATNMVLTVVSQTMQVISDPTPQGAFAVLRLGLNTAVQVVLPMAASIAALGIITNVAQTGMVFSTHALVPKFSRISPKAGLKRLFGIGTLEQLGRQLAKLAVLGFVAYGALSTIIKMATSRQPVALSPLLMATGHAILSYVRTVALLGLVIGAADFAYQKHHLLKTMKMTKHEVKEESRSAEGDPVIKGEIRKRQYAISRSQMLKAIRSADLVVTNPTHFTIGMRYEQGAGGAPVVVAKGSDDFARRLREEAELFGVPRVEDPPLARWMFTFCEVDRPIPPEIYTAVAKVLAFVYSLPDQMRRQTLRPVQSEVPIDPGDESGAVFARRYRREEAEHPNKIGVS